jgi:cephalosporin hydroxylase
MRAVEAFRVWRDAARARRRLDRATTQRERYDALPALIFSGLHQVPEEILAFLDFLGARRPTRILEIGIADGATNVLLSRCADSVEHMVGVDISLRYPGMLRRLRRRGLRLDLIEGASTDPATFAEVQRLAAPAGFDAILIDGDHRRAGVTADFELYRELVAPGGVVAFHDIVPDSRTRGGPDTGTFTGDVPAVWKELSQSATRRWEFVRDYDQDGYGIGVMELAPEQVASHVEPQLRRERE